MQTAAPGSLRTIALFSALAPATLSEIEERCRWRKLAPDEVLASQGDPPDDVYFIVSGKIKVAIYTAVGRVVVLDDLLPNSVIGEFSAIDNGPRLATFEAVEPSVVACLARHRFMELLASHDTLCTALMLHLAGRVRTLARRLVEVSVLAVRHRVQLELLRLARGLKVTDGSVVITQMPTHAEIASRAGTQREMVSRELANLVRLGLVERTEVGLRITDMERLADMVQTAIGDAVPDGHAEFF
jgi:CRP-like cAMP-binding protein